MSSSPFLIHFDDSIVDELFRVAWFKNRWTLGFRTQRVKFGNKVVSFFQSRDLTSRSLALRITRELPNWSAITESGLHKIVCCKENGSGTTGDSLTYKLERTEPQDRRKKMEIFCHGDDWNGFADDHMEAYNMQGTSEDCSHEGLLHTEYNREVNCQVEIVSWRERRIKASILVKTTEDRIWRVLTDYERLAEFIPNLVWSERIHCPHPGRIWLFQRGMQRTMYWHIEAYVVLELEEVPNSGNGKELRFSMVDGDFKHYEGKWYLRPGPRPDLTVLHYEVNVIPRLFFPAAFVQRVIQSDLPVNLHALAERAERDSLSELNASVPQKEHQSIASFSSNVDITKIGSDASAVFAQNKQFIETSRQLNSNNNSQGNRVHTIPVKYMGKKGLGGLCEMGNYTVKFGKACNLDRQCVADEIHFRRFDDLLENGGVYYRVVATITVKAHPEDLWAVLIAYEDLPEFVPNLASSRVLSRERNRVRLLQEGCKCLLYMALHARVVLDLWEQPGYKITFQQVEGDFDSFEGTWTLEQFGSQHTILKYIVETKMHSDCLLSEAMIEEVIYEDLPSNLCAIRDRVELSGLKKNSYRTEFIWESTESSKHPTCQNQMTFKPLEKNSPSGSKLQNLKETKLKSHARQPHVVGIHEDFKVLEKEIECFISNHGQEGVMPMRRLLRCHGRLDLEKAITGMGGFRVIATRMKLSLAYKYRKPKGYWDSIHNLKQEVIRFQQEHGFDKEIMPSRKSMEKSGRYDLARALEKWGGLREVAQILGLKTSRRTKYSPKQDLSRDLLTWKISAESEH
eukprot:c27871_g1_i2 orf=79-2469(+)